MNPAVGNLCRHILSAATTTQALERGFVTVGIGGHGASGKSTLAQVLAQELENVQIVGTDSFWSGSMFDLPRLRTELLDVVLTGHPAMFDEWDWHAKSPRPGRRIEPKGVIVIEGVCALHRMFRDDLDVRVWVRTPLAVCLERGVARDGESMRSTWTDLWIPNEARYVESDDPIACAHTIINGTEPYT